MLWTEKALPFPTLYRKFDDKEKRKIARWTLQIHGEPEFSKKCMKCRWVTTIVNKQLTLVNKIIFDTLCDQFGPTVTEFFLSHCALPSEMVTLKESVVNPDRVDTRLGDLEGLRFDYGQTKTGSKVTRRSHTLYIRSRSCRTSILLFSPINLGAN